MGAGALKARLLSWGRIHIPPGALPPFSLSLSTAGPGAGSISVFLEVRGSLVRLDAVRVRGAIRDCSLKPNKRRCRDPPVLERKTGKFRLIRGGAVLAGDVKVVPPGLHAPRQAFISIHNVCRYRCAFCALPHIPRKPRTPLDRWLEIVLDAVSRKRVDAIALTTGIPASPAAASLELARFVRSLRASLPEIPIGVEPYTTSRKDIEMLYSAGATELKLNIQCATERLMKRICPGLDWKGVWRALEVGTATFGKNRVCSNLILGLGETDQEVTEAAERLAGMGALVNLRPLRINPLNIRPLRNALGREPAPVPAQRILRLAAVQKGIFSEHSLRPSLFRTMCHRCTACELEPFRDV